MDTKQAVCQWCGRPLPEHAGRANNQRYCSTECRLAARKARLNQPADITELYAESQRRQQSLLATLDRERQAERTTLEMYEEQNQRLRDQLEQARQTLETVADELAWSLAHEVIVINRASPDYAQADAHAGWFRMLDRSGSWTRVRVEDEKEKLLTQMRAMRAEYSRESREHEGDQAYMDALKDRQAKRQAELRHECRHYFAWLDLQDIRDAYRDAHGADMPLDLPELAPILDRIRGDETAYTSLDSYAGKIMADTTPEPEPGKGAATH